MALAVTTAVLLATGAGAAGPVEADEPEETEEAPVAGIRHVPRDYPSIQAAIDAARDGDTVLVAPGRYSESISIAGKSVVLASHYLTSGNCKRIEETILKGTLAADEGGQERFEQVILVEESAGPATRIEGFTIEGGDDGISCHAWVEIVNNRFLANEDAIDYEGGGGLCRGNHFENNLDDAVDLDGSTAVEISYNTIRGNLDDGIEIRLHDHRGELLEIVISDNTIRGNGEDGIQIIGYARRSNRRIIIERNLIAGNAMAGIGFMSHGNTRENYEGAGIGEPILVANNTIGENTVGVSGGHRLVAVNNVLIDNRMAALWRVGGRSQVRRSLFWMNGCDVRESLVAREEMLQVDPELDEDFRPSQASPCIDAALDEFAAPWGPYEIDPATYSGEAPDLGAVERLARPAGG